MTWVKVCGITSREALEAAHEGGADAVGFVVAPDSPRRIGLADARAFIESSELPSYIVSVDLTDPEVLEVMRYTGAEGIQPHGRHGVTVMESAVDRGWKVLFPIPVDASGPRTDPASIPHHVMPILDTAAAGVHGGTGSTFDWSLVSHVDRPFVLAGGLDPGNVRDAVASVRPFGVDASSGLEIAPGIKDPDSIRAFIKEAKSA